MSLLLPISRFRTYDWLIVRNAPSRRNQVGLITASADSRAINRNTRPTCTLQISWMISCNINFISLHKKKAWNSVERETFTRNVNVNRMVSNEMIIETFYVEDFFEQYRLHYELSILLSVLWQSNLFGCAMQTRIMLFIKRIARTWYSVLYNYYLWRIVFCLYQY